MYSLYHFPYSQHSRRVVSLLEEAGLDYEIVPLAMDQGAHMAPEYLAINPNHQIPTLIDGDIKIHESNAILRYLCFKHDLTDWYPTEPAARALVEQWLDWNQCQLSPTVIDIVLNTVFMGEDGDHKAAERGRQALPELAQILEAGLTAGPYLAGNAPSIADLSVASNIFHLGFAEARPDSHNIDAWFARMSGLAGFQKSLPEAA
jgi:glutathione S-transferase